VTTTKTESSASTTDASRAPRTRRRVLLAIAAVVLAAALAVIIWATSFEWLERIFGYGGLCLLVFAVAAVKLNPSWGEVGNGFVPHYGKGMAITLHRREFLQPAVARAKQSRVHAEGYR